MTSKLKFREENMLSIKQELLPLFEKHYDEVGAFGGIKTGLNIQWAAYAVLEEKGMLHFVTARSGKKLVGYYVSIIAPHLHFKNILVAENDTLFLRKKYRTGLEGCRLIKYASELVRKKCDVIILNLPVGDAYVKVAKYAGFKLIGHKFTLGET